VTPNQLSPAVAGLLPLLLLFCASVVEARPPGLLIELGIEKDERKIVTQIYNAVVNPDDLKKGVGHFVANTDRKARARAAAMGKSPNSIGNLAGTWMEYSLMVALKQRHRTPLYWQVEFKNFRHNFYDIVLFTKEHGPVVLSPKTSLRERYKQADLEATALRSLFPQSKFFLLSLDSDKSHIANIQRKIAAGEIKGLTALYDETNIDELFKLLDSLTVIPPPAALLQSGRLLHNLPTFEDFRRADRERRTTGQLHTAESLALSRIDSNLIARVASEHPGDPEILFGAAELGGDWEPALRTNGTNNVVALRCALARAPRWFEHCRQFDPHNLVPWLTARETTPPETAIRFEDYEVPAARARIRCLEAAGYSAYAARRLSVLADKPVLALAQATGDQRLRVARVMQESPTFLVTELVGQSLEVAALRAAGPVHGKNADRVTELSNRREQLQRLLARTERAVELATEEEMVRYFDDVLAIGEEEAMRRLIQSHPDK